MDPACSECGGACCRSIVVPTPPEPWNEGARDWMTTRGRLRNNTWRIHAPCPQLSTTGLCGIWDSRPKICEQMEVGGTVCRDAIDAHLEPTHATRVKALLPKVPEVRPD